MNTSYYNYDSQKWCNDLEGFINFHTNELDYWTSVSGFDQKVKFHANMLIQAGQKDQLSDYVMNILNK